MRGERDLERISEKALILEYFIEESSTAAEFGILKSLRNEVYRFFSGR